MKALSIIGLILSFVGIISSIYAYTTVVPNEQMLQLATNRALWADAYKLKSLVGNIIIVTAAIGLIISLIPLFKSKNKLAFIAVLLNLAALGYWTLAFTHMFS